MSTPSDQSQFITVQVNLQNIQDLVKNQSIPLFVGIGVSFVLMALGFTMAFVVTKFMTTFLIMGAGFMVLFISFVLLYVDSNRRKGDLQDKINMAKTNLYSVAAQQDCPMYFSHNYDSTKMAYSCTNVNNIGESSSDIYKQTINVSDASRTYPYETAYLNMSSPSQLGSKTYGSS